MRWHQNLMKKNKIKTSSPKPSSKKKRFTVIKILKKVKTEHPRGELKRFETKQSHTEKVPSKDSDSTSRERSQSEKDIKNS